MQVYNNVIMLSLAARLRPQLFSQVIGQPLICKILSNGLTNKTLPSACLFGGPAGTGKTSLARITALHLVCSNKQEDHQACLQCENCQAALKNAHPDIMEFDAATNTGIDNILQCLEGMNYQTQLSTEKIYIIDEVHMLSKSAISALLKTIEEPMSNIWFLLATTDLHKIPYTIISRCLTLTLNSLSTEQLEAYLNTVCEKENYTFDYEALNLIAQASQGCVRKALSFLEQIFLINEKIDHETTLQITQFLSQNVIEQIYNIITSSCSLNQTEEALKAYNPYILTTQLLDMAKNKNNLMLAYHLAHVLEELSYSPCPEKVFSILIAKAALLQSYPTPDEIWKAIDSQKDTKSISTPHITQDLFEKAQIMFNKT